jgi:hypothetical protein
MRNVRHFLRMKNIFRKTLTYLIVHLMISFFYVDSIKSSAVLGLLRKVEQFT